MRGGSRWQPALAIAMLLLLLAPASLTRPTLAPPHVIPPGAMQFGVFEDHGMRDPVDVSLSFSPAPQVGLLSQLQVRVRSVWGDLAEVTVDLEAPEGLQMSDVGIAPFELVREEERIWGLPIRPLAGGLFQVTVRVRGFSPDHGLLGGHAVIFLDVPRQGPGAIHHDGPPVRSASGAAQRVTAPPPAPYGRNPVSSPGAMTVGVLDWPRTGSVGAAIGPYSHESFNVTGQWTYWMEDDVTASPQRWATVQVWDEDSGDDDLLWTAITDQTGNFTASDIPRAEEAGQGNQDVYVRFVACNTAACVQTTSEVNYSWQTETVTVGAEDELSFGTRAPATNQFAARPFQYINNAWDYAANLGGLQPVLGQVRVFIPDECTFYTLSDDTIHLCANGVDDKSPDDVGHEYGHYVQDKMYGDSFWPSPGGFHSACGDGQHPGLSWTEGFADFFGPRAHQEIVDPQDHNYTRPWDGSSFSFDLESVGVCSSNVKGDDNEMRVAASLWDLADDVDDGILDVGIRHSPSDLFGAINGCNQASYRAFYDGGLCNWLDRGRPRFDLLATAFQNTIDYNLEPMAHVTSPSAFAWLEGTVVVAANATDPDTNVTGVEFRVALTSSCTNFELPRETVTSPPYTATLNIAFLPEAPNYWVCARATDELEIGPWTASSSSFGIDGTPPASMATVTGTLGEEGWYVTPVTLELQASDAASGVASISFRLDDGVVLLYTDPFEIRADGVHTVAFFATDFAGNVESVQPLIVLIDTGPPIIQILQPTSGAYIGQSTVSITWSVTDTGAGVETCSVSLDGAPPVPVNRETAITFVGVSDGPHRAVVTCQDQIDRFSEMEVAFTVDTNPFSLTGPLGPTLILALAGLGVLIVALLLRRKR